MLFLQRYGEVLVCVRYRIPHNRTVRIRVDYTATELRKLVRNASDKWNAQERVWELQYGEVKQLGLTQRIVKNE